MNDLNLCEPHDKYFDRSESLSCNVREDYISVCVRNFSNLEMVLCSEEGRVCAVIGGKERSGEV